MSVLRRWLIRLSRKFKKKWATNLRFVFRNFPLAQSHPQAQHAAEAAEIAAQDGKFWEMHDILYENQNALDDESLKSYAEKIGLNAEKFSEDLESGKFEEKVQADFISGVESGVNGTPSFFINGIRFNGSFDYENLLKAIENAGL